jgi:hypothetical protein
MIIRLNVSFLVRVVKASARAIYLGLSMKNRCPLRQRFFLFPIILFPLVIPTGAPQARSGGILKIWKHARSLDYAALRSG